LKLKSRKIVLPNDVAADRILHFAALVLPSDEAMSYLMEFLFDGARAVSPGENK
jgi:hypothetical protein